MSHFDSSAESILMFYSISDIERECYLIIQSLIRSICESDLGVGKGLSIIRSLILVNVPSIPGLVINAIHQELK
jgi:hypothetical protein